MQQQQQRLSGPMDSSPESKPMGPPSAGQLGGPAGLPPAHALLSSLATLNRLAACRRAQRAPQPAAQHGAEGVCHAPEAPPRPAGVYLLRSGNATAAFAHAWRAHFDKCQDHDQARARPEQLLVGALREGTISPALFPILGFATQTPIGACPAEGSALQHAQQGAPSCLPAPARRCVHTRSCAAATTTSGRTRRRRA